MDKNINQDTEENLLDSPVNNMESQNSRPIIPDNIPPKKKSSLPLIISFVLGFAVAGVIAYFIMSNLEATTTSAVSDSTAIQQEETISSEPVNPIPANPAHNTTTNTHQPASTSGYTTATATTDAQETTSTTETATTEQVVDSISNNPLNRIYNR
ncbi:MAG: hypothetical protein IJC40_03805 [Muribaculaceae bacterium]|nr:hypothetical protein [Muribaculaceae bacterium]